MDIKQRHWNRKPCAVAEGHYKGGVKMGFFEPPNIDRMLMNNDVKGLIKALKHKDKSIRANAAKALADLYFHFKLKADEAAEPLIKAFEDNENEESWVSDSISMAFIRIKGWKEWERYLEMRKKRQKAKAKNS